MADLVTNALRRKLAAAEQAGDRAAAEKIRARLGQPDATAPEAEPETAPRATGLDAVEFASPAARELAESAALDASAFEGREKSSDYGFTKADVSQIVDGA